MFMGPLTESKPWATQGFIGIYRFLDKVWRIATEKEIKETPPSKELDRLMHKTIKKVTEDTSSLAFNTAISQMMVFVNELNKAPFLPKECLENLVLLLSPYTPHLSEELWERLGHKPSISNVAWPKYDEEKTKDDTVEIVIQINGKLRAKLIVDASTPKEELLKLAREDETVKKWTEGKSIIKEIVVPGKLINIVVK